MAEAPGSCPTQSAPPIPKNQIPASVPHDAAPAPDAHYVGAVTIQAVLSDIGLVCSAGVISGVEKKADREALKQVKAMRFDPPKKNGKAVATQVLIQVGFWRTPNGELVMEKLKQQKQANMPAFVASP